MKIKTFVLGIVTILMVVSCEKFLDIDQPDIIDQEHAFSDKNSTRLALIGIYGLMTDLVEPMFLAGEIRADLAIANKSAESYIKEFSNNSFSASNPYSSPNPFYTIINNTNDFINEFEGMLANQKMDSSDFIKYKAELVAIRVWSQYQVAKIFGTCKYYTEVLNSENISDIKNYSFEDKDFLRLLIDDLAFSDTNVFTPINEDIVWKTVRISDFYVNALMGELYMDLGEYENAIDKFDEVTKYGDRKNSSKNTFKITTKFNPGYFWFIEYFASSWETSQLVNNAAFMIGFDSKYNQSNELLNWTLSLNYQVAPAAWYYLKFEEHAFSDELTFKTDYRFISVEDYFSDYDRRPYAISKYLEEDRPFILTRTARITLLRAFCYNASGDQKKALKDINDVRKRIDFLTIDESEMPSDPKGAMNWLEDVIIDELAYETGFEGQRWFDLMRVALRRGQDDPSYLANRVAQKYPEESREQIRTKLLDKANWYIPVFE